MASIALTIAGTAWGAVPIGAGGASLTGILGAAIGGYIDSALTFPLLFQPEGQTQDVGNFTLTIADEGVPIVRAYGRAVRVPATLLYVSDQRPRDSTTGGGKRGEITRRSWFVDLLIGGAPASIRGGDPTFDQFNYVERIYLNDTLLFDERDEVDISVLVEGGDVIGQGYRNGVVINYDQFATFFARSAGPSVEGLVSIEVTPNIDRTIAYSSSASVGGSPRFVHNLLTFGAAHGFDPNQGFLTRWVATSGTPTGIWADQNIRYLIAHETDPAKAYLIGEPAPTGGVTWSVQVLGNDIAHQNSPDLAVFDPGGPNLRITTPSHGTLSWPIYDTTDLPNGRTRIRLKPYYTVLGAPAHNPYWEFSGTYAGTKHQYPANEFWHLLANSAQTLRIKQNRTPYNLDVVERGAADMQFSSVVSRDVSWGGIGIGDQPVLPFLEQFVGENLAPAYRGRPVIAIRDFNKSSGGSALGNIQIIQRQNDTTRAEVIQNIWAQYGGDVSRIDVSQVSGDCEGYQTRGVIEGVQALQPLLTTYGIRTQETEDGIRFFDTDLAPEITVPEEDWLDDPRRGKRLRIREQNSQLELRSLTIKFQDPDEDYAPATYRKVVQSVPNGEERVVDTNLVLTQDEAEAITKRMVSEILAGRWVADGVLPRKYIDLLENTIINTTHDGVAWRFRVREVFVQLNDEVRVSMVQAEEALV